MVGNDSFGLSGLRCPSSLVVPPACPLHFFYLFRMKGDETNKKNSAAG
jgi:hypothetical protein